MTLLSLFVLIIAVVVTHESGHYLAARLLNVRIMRVGLGFGRPLYSRFSRGGVEYAIGRIPLGGYVQLEPPPRDGSFNKDEYFDTAQPRKRILIALAGPAANIFFAGIALSFVLLYARTLPPILGPIDEGGLVSATELEAGDRIDSVNGIRTDTFLDARRQLMRSALRGTPAEILYTRDGSSGSVTVPPPSRGQPLTREMLTVSDVRSSGPFEVLSIDGSSDGLAPGDVVVAVDGEPLTAMRKLRESVADSGGSQIELTVLRNGETLIISRAPIKRVSGEHSLGLQLRSIYADAARINAQSFGYLAGGLRHIADMGALFAAAGQRFIAGTISLTGIGATVAHASDIDAGPEDGLLRWFTAFALLSTMAAFLNIVPMPFSDGGRALTAAVESLLNKSVPFPILRIAHFSLLLIIGFRLLAAVTADFA